MIIIGVKRSCPMGRTWVMYLICLDSAMRSMRKAARAVYAMPKYYHMLIYQPQYLHLKKIQKNN